MPWLRKISDLLDGSKDIKETHVFSSDPRWKKLHIGGTKCATCGLIHKGLFDLGIDHPTLWPGLAEDEMDRNNALLEDFCVVEGENFFIRCVLEIPIIGLEHERFGYGIWSSLSQSNFELYNRTFKSGTQGELGPWFGWFSNSLKGYPETNGLKCDVYPRNGNQRPTIQLQPTDHPLAVEQSHGISIDRLFELYEINGHKFD